MPPWEKRKKKTKTKKVDRLLRRASKPELHCLSFQTCYCQLKQLQYHPLKRMFRSKAPMHLQRFGEKIKNAHCIIFQSMVSNQPLLLHSTQGRLCAIASLNRCIHNSWSRCRRNSLLESGPCCKQYFLYLRISFTSMICFAKKKKKVTWSNSICN